MKTEQYTYIKTTHRTVNKKVIKLLADTFPTAVGRSKEKNYDGLRVTYVYDKEGESLGWAFREFGKPVTITIKNY
jgi:hypothetical protein